MEINDEIKNSLDIADIIGEKVKLKRSSRGFTGLCPFHDEKTPSFHVFTDTQSYYCFGCGASGDIFTFIMKTEGLNFNEALEILASRAGIKLERRNSSNFKKEKSLYEILEIAANFFKANLNGVQGSAARAYIQRRNLDENDCSKFSLGYSLNSWDSLINYLRKGGIKDEQLLKSGLALSSSRGSLYDRFRGRIIFPVRDITGRVIAFGGRLIDGEGAKYINSPESEIYSKRKNLYLLDEAKKFIREKDRAILVEGYMDALRLHKSGFPETVASLGTSLTAEQAALLSRFSSRCYICYDSDEAGQNAILRGMYILQENGIDVQVVQIPEGKDPDEFLSSNSASDFEKALENSKPLVLHQIKSLEKLPRKAAIKELFENLSRLNISDILPYRSQISEFTLLPPTEIEKFLTRGPQKNYSPIQKSRETFVNNYEIIEAAFCSMLFYYSECRLNIEPSEALEILSGSLARETAFLILTENPRDLYSLWLSAGETEKIGLITRGAAFCKTLEGENVIDKWNFLLSIVKSSYRKRKISEIQNKLSQNKASASELLLLQKLMKSS
ncbi:MAG: DNA primase [Synergistaceae bacterium]|nr:DNA primase [Synergistaceae bacterium]